MNARRWIPAVSGAALCILAGVTALENTVSAQWSPASRGTTGSKEVTSLLGDPWSQGGTDYHPNFTDDEYLSPRKWPVKGGFCFFFDDGDTSFLKSFIAMSDSIYDGLGAYSSLAGIRIRGTTAMSVNQVGTVGVMTPAYLREVNAKSNGQQDFEIAGHGGDEARIGWRGLDAAGARVSYGSGASQITGMSYAFADTVIRSAQDSTVAWGIPAFRSWGYGNWKSMSVGLPEIFRKYGIYQTKQLCIPAAYAQTDTDPNEQSDQVRNQDEYPSGALELNASQYWGGFQRIGGMMSAYDIGARGSFNTGSATSSTPDSVTAYIDVCAQMQCLGIATFHAMNPDAEGRGNVLFLLESELSAFMVHVATRIQEGVLESLTFEQVAARMRGIRDGNLIPHQGFRKLNDGVATHLAPNTRVINTPIGWPISPELYSTTGDTMVAAGGATANWKVFDLSTVDTVLVSYTGRGAGGEDSLSYAAADTSRNILICGSTSFIHNSGALELPIVVSGCDAKFIKLAFQVACLKGNAYTMPASAEFYVGIKALQFEEMWEDNMNGGGSGAVNVYESMADLVGTRNVAQQSFANYNFEHQRVRPVGALWSADTLVATTIWDHPPTAWQAEQTQAMMGNPWRLRPYILYGKSSGWDWQLSFAGFATELRFAGAGMSSAPFLNWNYIDKFADATEFVFYIPVDPKVDYVYFMASVERITVSFLASDVTWAIYAMDAYPIR